MRSNHLSLFAGAGVLVCLTAGFIAGQITPRKNDRVLAERMLPPMDGARLRATLAEVSYDPGMSSPAHTHGCPVMGYVLTGAVRFQVNKEPEVLLHAGETFYERPNSLHNISGNASKTEGAKFLAFFVCAGDQQLAMPADKNGQGAQ